ncbi:hypothetical protein R69927_04959 [Paraburkholderia domus]|jgi:Integral membrane protein, interacts with FtsH|uniref:Uncharacterized protein n=1 Tax=Paraburkholderia domus TaxID=2793075 RepID=A0A9N8R102_9BURK|nr:Bax inhibitor-1 family protein [Paraburkholderia domus]CAE6803580.1 hypothetical protein R70006_05415 [Paraburkholderia domus]CAE6861082.1 hypothetical protein R69749_05450 [Paraburkholderia domus]CAE6893527.1 hypothetical protein R69927_04959 [Paraburkholderia domus]CAE6938030.1 hypothetical protein R70199_05884 [Paraburkholderia domus]CAE6947330.1 hypothetical protein R70211_06050 [Paraburkholderia domus]
MRNYVASDAREKEARRGLDSSDLGLRQYMLRVYNYMAGGLALTGVIAYVAAMSGFYVSVAATPLFWVVLLAPLGLVMFLSFRIESISLGAAQIRLSQHLPDADATPRQPPPLGERLRLRL